MRTRAILTVASLAALALVLAGCDREKPGSFFDDVGEIDVNAREHGHAHYGTPHAAVPAQAASPSAVASRQDPPRLGAPSATADAPKVVPAPAPAPEYVRPTAPRTGGAEVVANPRKPDHASNVGEIEVGR